LELAAINCSYIDQQKIYDFSMEGGLGFPSTRKSYFTRRTSKHPELQNWTLKDLILTFFLNSHGSQKYSISKFPAAVATAAGKWWRRRQPKLLWRAGSPAGNDSSQPEN
jgi:hypothetical protein